MIFYSGEKPPEGTYMCVQCASVTYNVPEIVKELPECPECGCNQWIKA